MWVYHSRWRVRHNGTWVTVFQIGPWFFNGNPLTEIVWATARWFNTWAVAFAFVSVILAIVWR